MFCISTKRLTYLAEDENNQVDNLISFLKRQRPYRVEINDLLSIRLKALDQELTSMFNPIGDTENSTATTEERAYFDGFLVGRHGEIMIKKTTLIHSYIQHKHECEKSKNDYFEMKKITIKRVN